MKLIDLVLPTEDEMDAMSLEELKVWREKLAPYYVNRFEYVYPESKKAYRYLWFDRMIRNVEEGVDKWYRVVGKRVKAIPNIANREDGFCGEIKSK